MTNFEKYKDDIIKAEAYGDRVGVKDGKLIKCDYRCLYGDESCCCGERMIDWLNAEYVEPEIDWSKVPIDTKVLCRDIKYGEFVKRYYAGINEYGNPCAFLCGRTSWSSDGATTHWKFMKLAEEE